MYSPLNSYAYIHWILDFKYILLLNNIVLTLLFNESKVDIRIHSLNLFHSHGASEMNERSGKVFEQSLLIGGIISW